MPPGVLLLLLLRLGRCAVSHPAVGLLHWSMQGACMIVLYIHQLLAIHPTPALFNSNSIQRRRESERASDKISITGLWSSWWQISRRGSVQHIIIIAIHMIACLLSSASSTMTVLLVGLILSLCHRQLPCCNLRCLADTQSTTHTRTHNTAKECNPTRARLII